MHNKWIIIRPSAVYGPNDDLSRVIPKWVNNVKTGEPIEVRGDSLLDFTYIDDLAQAVNLCVTSNTINEVFNISRGKARSLMEAAVQIVEHMGKGEIHKKTHNITKTHTTIHKKIITANNITNIKKKNKIITNRNKT